MNQIRERSRQEVRNALNSMADKMKGRTRREPDDDLHTDSVLEDLRKLVPSEFLVAWAAWTTASDLISPSRMTDAVRWVVWVLYTIAAFFYVLWQLHRDRSVEECADCLLDEPQEEAADAPAETPLDGTGRSVESQHARQSQRALQSQQSQHALQSQHSQHVLMSQHSQHAQHTERVVSIAMSNGAAGSNESTVSGFPDVYDEQWQRVPLLGTVGSNSAGTGGQTRSTPSARSARRGGGFRQSPSNAWLSIQALVSAAAFMLLTAATGDVYMRPNVMLWGVLALMPLFPLFAQFVLPNGIRRRLR